MEMGERGEHCNVFLVKYMYQLMNVWYVAGRSALFSSVSGKTKNISILVKMELWSFSAKDIYVLYVLSLYTIYIMPLYWFNLGIGIDVWLDWVLYDNCGKNKTTK